MKPTKEEIVKVLRNIRSGLIEDAASAVMELINQPEPDWRTITEDNQPPEGALVEVWDSDNTTGVVRAFESYNASDERPVNTRISTWKHARIHIGTHWRINPGDKDECQWPAGTNINILYRNGIIDPICKPEDLRWNHEGGGGDIMQSIETEMCRSEG